MKKRLKKWGNSLVIVFTKEDEEVYGLEDGDVINIDDIFIQMKGGNEKKDDNKNRV